MTSTKFLRNIHNNWLIIFHFFLNDRLYNSNLKFDNLKLEVQSLKYITTKSETIKMKNNNVFLIVGNGNFSVGTLKYLEKRY